MFIIIFILSQISSSDFLCKSCNTKDNTQYCVDYPVSETKPEITISAQCISICQIGGSISVTVDDTKTKVNAKEESITTGGTDTTKELKINILNFRNSITRPLTDGEINVQVLLIPSGAIASQDMRYFSCKLILDTYPVKVTGISITPSDKQLLISWSHPDRDITEYTILWGERTKDNYPQNCTQNRITTKDTSYTITNLENGKEYCISLMARDNGGKESQPTSVLTGTPKNLKTFSELSDENVGCVIARNVKNKEVLSNLRSFRDKLKQNFLGKILVRIYYFLSKMIINILNLLSENANAEYLISFKAAVSQLEKNGKNIPVWTHLWKDTYPGNFVFLTMSGGYGKITRFGTPFFLAEVGITTKTGNGVELIVQDGKITYKTEGNYSSFLILPAALETGYRFEYIYDQILVPYGKGGFDMWFFQESASGKKSQRGRLSGYHWSAGAMLLLDVFEKSAAQKIYNEFGVKNSFIFFEFRQNLINLKRGEKVWNMKKSNIWDFSDKMLIGGLAFDFE